MATTHHRELTPEDIHEPYSFSYSNEIERNKDTSISSKDVNKLAIQQNNRTIWLLLDTKPTWKQVLTEGSPTLPRGNAGGDLKGSYPNPSVVDDSHQHSPGISIPAYPTTLRPSGSAGGSLDGNYPNPRLSNTGVTAGLYTNPQVEVNSEGRITSIVSNRIGEANEAINIGVGKEVYAEKQGSSLLFRTLKVEANSGLNITQSSNEIEISNLNLAKLSGANFSGDISSPNLKVDEKVETKILHTPLHDAGIGGSWTPDVANGVVQKRIISGNTFINEIRGVEAGMRLILILKQNTVGNHYITLADEYKVKEGENKVLSLPANSIDVLEVTVLSSNFYLTLIHRNFK